MRLSIYLLQKKKKQSNAISSFILDEFNNQPIRTKSLAKSKISGYRKGLFFYQEFTKSQAGWVNNINNLLQKDLSTYEHKSIRAVLIMQVNRRYFALSFNSGISLVKSDHIDYNFGFEMAKKLLDEKKISGYYSTEFSENIINTKKNSLKSIPSHIINDRKKLSIVNSLSGKGSGEIKTRIVGKYNLALDFNGDLNTELIAHLKWLSSIYFDKRDTGISLLNTMSQIKNDDVIDSLNERLFQDISTWCSKMNIKNSLTIHDLSHVFFNIDHDEAEDDFLGYAIDGLGYKSSKIYSSLDKQDYFERFCNQINRNPKEITYDYIINKLKRDNIYAVEKDSSEQTKIENIYNALILTYDLPQKDSEKKAILISGKWFYVSLNYYFELESQIELYKDVYKGIHLSGFSKTDTKIKKDSVTKQDKKVLDEGAYNERIAKDNDLDLFDQYFYKYSDDLRKSGFNSRSKIEPCDLLKYDSKTKQLVMWHIKRGTGAQGISHLTTQAETSASILFDKHERKNFIEFLNKKISGDKIPFDITPADITIVLGITKEKPKNNIRDIFSLLELSSLSRSLTKINSQGFTVSLNLISDNTKRP